jgi:PIN domain nuclease of toxin-antitoxin system
MDILLDTHTTKWFFDDDKRLSKSAIEAICHPGNNIYISIASIWEVAIKISIGKMQVNGGIIKFIEVVDDNGFLLLDISPKHITEVAELPFIHRDPFDRILIAQAKVEDMSIMTVDGNIIKYGIKHIW